MRTKKEWSDRIFGLRKKISNQEWRLKNVGYRSRGRGSHKKGIVESYRAQLCLSIAKQEFNLHVAERMRSGA